jgi:hypothetical protein
MPMIGTDGTRRRRVLVASRQQPAATNRPRCDGGAVRPGLLLALLATLLLALPATSTASRTPPTEAATVLGDPWFAPRAQAALDAVYGFEVDAARTEIGVIGARYPGHPVYHLLAAQLEWWWILTDPEVTSRDAFFEQQLEAALAAADRRLARWPGDADARYAQATALAGRARLRSLRGQWVPAAYEAQRSLTLVRGLAREQPRNPDLQLGLGLYDYFAAAAPQRYGALRPLAAFFPKGDRERGLERLEHAAAQGRLSRIEASYFLLQIRFHFETDYTASRQLVRELRAAYPRNPVFHSYEGRIQARFGQWGQAAGVMRGVLDRHAAGEPGYGSGQAEHALYVLARCAMGSGDFDGALRYLARLERLAAPRSSPYVQLAHLRRGMAYDALGTRPAAVAEYRRVLALPDAADTHDRAREFLRRPWAG